MVLLSFIRSVSGLKVEKHRLRPIHVDSRSSMFRGLEVRESKGKGLGIFTTERIPAYTRVIVDKALIGLRQDEDLFEAHQQYLTLPLDQRNAFLTYHRHDIPERDLILTEKLKRRMPAIPTDKISEMVTVSSIFTANAFKVPSDLSGTSSLKHGMFATVSRINHSCEPNAHSNFNGTSEEMLVHTLHDVEKGSEILISYFNLLLPYDQRQAKAAQWGFECSCPACAAGPSEEQNEHEAKRARIRYIEGELLSVVSQRDKADHVKRQAVEHTQEMLDIVKADPSLKPQLPNAYEYLAMAQMTVFEIAPDKLLLNATRENLALAVDVESCITGANSHSTMKRREKLKSFSAAVESMPKASTMD